MCLEVGLLSGQGRPVQRKGKGAALLPDDGCDECITSSSQPTPSPHRCSQVEELGAQLAAAAEWQAEVAGMREGLEEMQAAVAESEAARQAAQVELGGALQQREGELMQATARLAAAEAQLAALQGCAGGGALAGFAPGLRPAGELLAAFTISQAQLSAALAEAAALLA